MTWYCPLCPLLLRKPHHFSWASCVCPHCLATWGHLGNFPLEFEVKRLLSRKGEGGFSELIALIYKVSDSTKLTVASVLCCPFICTIHFTTCLRKRQENACLSCVENRQAQRLQSIKSHSADFEQEAEMSSQGACSSCGRGRLRFL